MGWKLFATLSWRSGVEQKGWIKKKKTEKKKRINNCAEDNELNTPNQDKERQMETAGV